MPPRVKTKVYRLRNLPGYVDRHSAAQLLARFVEDLPLDHINIHSLANTVDPWELTATRTATLTFAQEPSLPSKPGQRDDEWEISVPGLRSALILDVHFEGFTPLNDADPTRHAYDCIAISGLASHPFGSWQPHGADKSFMWLRDALPPALPSFRFLTYGYDTALLNSLSFQSIPDLAGRLILEMKSNGWASPGAKQVVFLAHSLGGVLLKQVLVMLANSGESEIFMLDHIRGAILFGVPSQGMVVSHLLAMTDGQPNAALVGDLSVDSPYLANLAMQFDGISQLRKMRFFWGYETKLSPTVIRNEHDGSFSRGGPPVVLVSKSSATNGVYSKQPLSTFQIDDDHSGMVKFSQSDNRMGIVIQNLRDIVDFPSMDLSAPGGNDEGNAETAIPSISKAKRRQGTSNSQFSNGELPAETASLVNGVVNDMLNSRVLIDSLRAPERDRRLEQIDPAYVDTFEWAYDDESIGFSNWLGKGEGIFWISGKPGSGKSTLMKLIHGDRRTAELINRWGSKYKPVTATFFFHHRGTVIQKSFEGLLRGVISQLMEKEPNLLAVIRQMLVEEYAARVESQRLGDLPSDILGLFDAYRLRYNDPADREVREIMMSLDARAQLYSTCAAIFSDMPEQYWKPFELTLLAEKSSLLKEMDRLEAKIEGLCEKKLRVKYSYELVGSIRTWLRRVDLKSRITQLLVRSGLSSKDIIAEDIKRCLTRQEKRDAILRDTQQKVWTRQSLEAGLSRILEQERFHLDLTLFLDALDEYDGRPEFIAEFLADITRKRYSHTRVRVCFSSRPWNVFEQEFGVCPGFKIHEHTEDDIRSYCLDAMADEPDSSWTMTELVPEIVRRAQGVFLWVRLVVSDLTAAAARFSSMPSAESRTSKLWEILKALPDQLDDYYVTIVQRIPMASRWDTYVLLECVSRARWDFDIPMAGIALGCSRASEFDDGKQRAQAAISQPPSRREFLVKLRTLSGGLVEAIEGPDSVVTLQLMHQTVKEFVQHAEFKHKILGSVAKVTSENGHSFLAKAYFLGTRGSSFTQTGIVGHHAREAEITTGRSQYSLFRRSPQGYFPAAAHTLRSANQGQNWLTSPLTFAVFYGLNLYIKDALAEDPGLAGTDEESLFSTLLASLQGQYQSGEYVLKTARLLADCGCVPTWVELRTLCDHYDPLSHDLEPVVLPFYRRSAQRIPRYNKLTTTPLMHLGYPRLLDYLIMSGDDVNVLDDEGNTPLDGLVTRSLKGYIVDFPQAYGSACLLAKHGGYLRTVSGDEWNGFLEYCGAEGADRGVFRACGQPRWMPKSSSALKERKRRTVGNPEIQGQQRASREKSDTQGRQTTQVPQERQRKRGFPWCCI